MGVHVVIRAAFALVLLVAGARAAGPQPPCAATATPAYPPADSPPAVTIWHSKELEQWHPPACTGWAADSRSKLIVTLTGSFRFDGAMSDLLARIGNVSALRNIQYW